MIKEFTKLLEARVTSLTMSGTQNLFAGSRPASAPDVSVVVEEPFDDLPDAVLKDAVRRTFRVECRGNESDYFSARDVAMAIQGAIHAVMQITLPVVDSGATYLVNISCSRPAAISPDEKGRPLVVVYAYLETREN